MLIIFSDLSLPECFVNLWKTSSNFSDGHIFFRNKRKSHRGHISMQAIHKRSKRPKNPRQTNIFTILFQLSQQRWTSMGCSHTLMMSCKTFSCGLLAQGYMSTLVPCRYIWTIQTFRITHQSEISRFFEKKIIFIVLVTKKRFESKYPGNLHRRPPSNKSQDYC